MPRNLPDPGELARQLANGSVSASAPAAGVGDSQPSRRCLASIAELAAHLETGKRFQLAQQVRDYLRPVRFDGSEFEFGAARDAAARFRPRTWRRALREHDRGQLASEVR